MRMEFLCSIFFSFWDLLLIKRFVTGRIEKEMKSLGKLRRPRMNDDLLDSREKSSTKHENSIVINDSVLFFFLSQIFKLR